MQNPTHTKPRVALNDFARQWASTEQTALAAFRRVGERGWFVLGPEVKAFEQALAAWWQMDFAVGCGNGMDAIEIGLRAAGIRPGDTVLTTPLSAFATSLAIARAQARPVFVDVDASGMLDLEAADAYFSKHPETKFLLPVHLYGHALSLGHLRALQQKHGLKVIEDCAQAIGAKSAGEPVGTVGIGAATSFYPTKNLGCLGDGGAFLTDDPEVAENVRRLRDYGQSGKYVHQEVGLNSRLDELQASLLLDCFLPKLTDLTARRARTAKTYLAGIHHPNVRILPVPERSESVWHLFPVCIDGDRESFRKHLADAGVETAIHYPATIPAQAATEKICGKVEGSFPNAERLCATEVSLPIHPYLKDDEIARVITACNDWRPE